MMQFDTGSVVLFGLLSQQGDSEGGLRIRRCQDQGSPWLLSLLQLLVLTCVAVRRVGLGVQLQRFTAHTSSTKKAQEVAREGKCEVR